MSLYYVSFVREYIYIYLSITIDNATADHKNRITWGSDYHSDLVEFVVVISLISFNLNSLFSF